MATQSVNNALQTFYHHQQQLYEYLSKQTQDITTITVTTDQDHDQDQHQHQKLDKEENMWCSKQRQWQSLKTTIQSRKWKRKTRNILDHIFPLNSAILTTLILIIVVISKNPVHAAQRDNSQKSKDPNSLNAISGYGVATPANPIITSNNNTSNGNTATSSSSPLTVTSVAISSSSSTAIATATATNRNRATSSGVHRNTIEVNEENRNGPYFDKNASKNVTALLGKTAYLNCRVKNLGNKTMLLQVSWVRHRDIHLLTVGRYTYTSDQRFRAIHQPQTEDWILQIKYPQHRDSGIYECQVSTTPHMSHYIHLNVVEPSTEIIGAPDLYIESGSTINLTCVILNSPEPPAYIFWNHNSAIINYDSPRGGVSVVTNKGETTTSFLLIKMARPSDSGQYQCNPSNSKSKGVTVHVLNGEFPAAMQRAGQAHHRMSPNHYLLVCLSTFLSAIVFIKQYQKIPNVITRI